MLGRLRMKFIILSTIALLLLLGIIIVSSNLLTYREMLSNADKVLDMIADSGGRPAPFPPPDYVELSQGDKEGARKNISGHFGRMGLSPETMYEARFFVAGLSAEGRVLFVNTERIAMVDDAKASDYASQVYRKKSDRGFVGDFRYVRFQAQDEDENDTYVIFLDCGRNLAMFQTSLLTNCAISFLGLLAVFVLIIIFSGKIMRPVSESYEKQKQFISVAGHELKTPVTIIDADAELLAMEIGEENEWLADISRQTRRMAALTNDLLTLSRMDENRQQFTRIDFPVSDVVGETVLSFQTLAHGKNQNIRAEIAPMLSCRGDENSVRQLVGILLDNAIKYSRGTGNGSCADIMLKLEKKGQNLYLSVTNSSEPVSEEQFRHFFDRFYRTEQSRNSETGGYGLGLSIAKSIVEAHKGRITASAPEPGTVQLAVVLPIK